MRMAILGSGNVGGAVGRAAMIAGHEVVLTATTQSRAKAVAEGMNASTAASNAEAVDGADMVVLAVPYGSIDAIAREIAGPASGKVVIDPTNPLRDDFSGLAVTERSGAEEVQRRLPGARVVKAFNTVLAANMATPTVDGVALDGFYAGDDEDAKKQVAAFLSAVGYRPVDVGPLRAALALEHMAFLNIALNAGNNWAWQSGWKLVGPGPQG